MSIGGGRKSRARRPSPQARRAAEQRAAEITAEFQSQPVIVAARPAVPPAPVVKEPRVPASNDAAEIVAIMERLERRYGAAVEAAKLATERAAISAKWSHKWEGTPETHEAIDRVPSRRRQSSLARMAALGKITKEELVAGEEISNIVEMIERAVSVRSGSLEARVDCAGSARDQLVESLGRIRAEVAYRAWREKIPKPKRMIIDMVLTNVPYVRLAGAYNLHWRTARKRLISALRMWPEIKLLTRYSISPEDVNETYARIGEGTLLPPKPRTPPPSLGEEGSE